MRKFVVCLTLALCAVPTLVLAQTSSECKDRQVLTEMAIEVRDRVSEGDSEESLLTWASDIEAPGLQAAAYKAIEAYTFRPAAKNVPQVVTVMGYLCNKTYSP